MGVKECNGWDAGVGSCPVDQTLLLLSTAVTSLGGDNNRKTLVLLMLLLLLMLLETNAVVDRAHTANRFNMVAGCQKKCSLLEEPIPITFMLLQPFANKWVSKALGLFGVKNTFL